MLEYETNVVEQLFSCSLSLAQWDFVGSLLHLHNYNQTYKEFIEWYKGKERSLMGKKIIKVCLNCVFVRMCVHYNVSVSF